MCAWRPHGQRNTTCPIQPCDDIVRREPFVVIALCDRCATFSGKKGVGRLLIDRAALLVVALEAVCCQAQER